MASSSPEIGIAGGGRLAADPRSVKARVKPTAVSGLLNLLKFYGTDVENSNVQVCEGRKCCHALQTGKITHPACFINEAPTPSRKSVRGQPPHVVELKSTVIPDGWKVACVVEGRAWIAETSVIDNEMRYRFSLVKEDGQQDTENVSPWAPNPSGAFKSLFHKLCPDRKLESHNGKLYIGCHYEGPQISLQNHFRTEGIDPNVLKDYPELKELLDLWLANQDLPIERKRQKRMGLGNGEQDPSSSASSMSPTMSLAPSLTDASSVTSSECSPIQDLFDFDFNAFLNHDNANSGIWDDEILDLIINEDHEIPNDEKKFTRDQAENINVNGKIRHRIGKPEKEIPYKANMFCCTFTVKSKGELQNMLLDAYSMIQNLKAMTQSKLAESSPFAKYVLPRPHVDSTQRIIKLVYDLQIRKDDMDAEVESETFDLACSMVDFGTALAMVRVRLAERLLEKARSSLPSDPIVYYIEFIEENLKSSMEKHPYPKLQGKMGKDKVLDAYINENLNEDDLDDFFPPFHTVIPPASVRESKANKGFNKLLFFVTASPLLYLLRH